MVSIYFDHELLGSLPKDVLLSASVSMDSFPGRMFPFDSHLWKDKAEAKDAFALWIKFFAPDFKKVEWNPSMLESRDFFRACMALNTPQTALGNAMPFPRFFQSQHPMDFLALREILCRLRDMAYDTVLKGFLEYILYNAGMVPATPEIREKLAIMLLDLLKAYPI